MRQPPQLLQCLRNQVFARLYFAQTINLVGDALTWVGLALLAFELAGKNAGVILSGALTLRVAAFVLLSPLAGAIADRFDRKRIMVVTHLARMGIVCLLPFVTQAWQIYAIVFALNVFYAFFTPTYTATIPLVTGKTDYPQAIALSSATFQLLGVLGPGLAGGIAAFIGARQVFFLDALTFLIATILVVTLPGQLKVDQNQQSTRTVSRTLQDIKEGTTRLFSDASIRYALAMQLVASVTGAQILVNTVGYVQGTLNLGKVEYGWVMAAFGIGATLASVAFGNFNLIKGRFPVPWGVRSAKKWLFHTPSACGGVVDSTSRAHYVYRNRGNSYYRCTPSSQFCQFRSTTAAVAGCRRRAIICEFTDTDFDCRSHSYRHSRTGLWGTLCLESPMVGIFLSTCGLDGQSFNRSDILLR